METIYQVKVHGKTRGAIGIKHDFEIEVTMDGIGHTEEEIRLECYEQASHIEWIKVISQRQVKDEN